VLFEIIQRVKFWKNADRIGPDIPYTHWRLYFKSTMRKLCKAKFKYFDDTAEFRPGAYAVCCSKISIGKRVAIRPGCRLYANVKTNGASITIEDDAIIGSGVHMYPGNHKFDDADTPIVDQGYEAIDIVLRKGCWIGANSIILKGVSIGENAVVGAGSIVTKSVPDRVVVCGNPARIVKKL